MHAQRGECTLNGDDADADADDGDDDDTDHNDCNDEQMRFTGSAIEMEVQLRSINFSLFGEKMRDATNTFFFNPTPLSLSSPSDRRGHPTSRGAPDVY